MVFDSPAIYLAGLLSLGMFAQWLAWRLRLPAIVLLLAFGFASRYLVGPPQEFLPDRVLFPIVALSVGVILFEGGLSLRFRELRQTGGVVFRLVTVGLVITWLGTAAAAYWLLGFSREMAALVGALLTVSGPTVIVPLLNHVQPVRRIRSVVKWEGIVNDPIGAVLAALVFETIVLDPVADASSHWLRALGLTLLVGVVGGGVTAWITIQVLRRFWVPDYLQSPAVLAAIVMVFSLSNAIQPESGLVTVTVFGIVLANQRSATIKHVIEFKENLRVLLISTLFIVLASNVDVSMAHLQAIGWRGAAFVALLVLLVRPLAVLSATLGSELSWKERLLVGWVHPRGIVAAAVASLFALQMAGTGHADEAQQLVLVTFLVIVATVVIYGLTLAPLARWLGLAVPDPQGVLFAGGSPLVREMAATLKAEGFATLVVDTNPQHIAEARMAGLGVCFASIGSEFVREEADLGDVGRLLAMTPNDEVNTLAAMEFAERFGRAEVYQLATVEPTNQRRDRVAAYRRGRTLFRKEATFEVLASRWAGGAILKKTLITEDFTFDDFRARYGENTIVLFAVDGQRLIVNTTEGPKTLKAGQKVIALVDPVEPPVGEDAEPGQG